MTTRFVLGTNSRRELQGVHPNLVRIVERAITLTPVDFGVHDGLRTEAEQRQYVTRGVSQTMNSKHLRQATTGFGHAVDLVPFINGKLRWEWPPIYEIAAAMAQSCRDLNLDLRWGGCWRMLSTIEPNAKAMERAVAEYGALRRRQGRKVFTDGPHYEIV